VLKTVFRVGGQFNKDGDLGNHLGGLRKNKSV
jgi:hypothetical protein